MKILQVGPYPPPMGGWSYHIQQFQRYLTEKGVENQVLNMGASRRESIPGCIPVLSLWDYIKKHRYYLSLGYTVYNHVDGCSWKGFVLTVISQILSLLFKRRPYLSFHAGVDQHCFDKKRLVYRLLAFITFASPARIICNSDLVKELILTFGKRDNDVLAIPCFSEQYLEYEKRLSKEHLRFIREHRLVLFCYLFFREGFMIESLLRTLAVVVKKYPDTGIILVGSTAGSERYVTLAQELGVADYLFLAGDVDHDLFLSLLGESDLCIRTHFNDGVCSSVLESLSLGVPVVAAYNPLRPEEVVTYTADEEDMCQKVLWAVENLESLRQRFSERTVEKRDTMKEEYEMLMEAAS